MHFHISLQYRKDSSLSSWTNTLKHSLAVEEAGTWITLTIQANYFTLTTIWKHVASSFWCVFSPFQSPVKHFIIQPFGVSVGLHGPSTNRWGTSIHQEAEEGRGNAEKQENWWNNEGKEECKSLTGRRQHRDRVGGCSKDDGFIITQALLISNVQFEDEICSLYV